MNKYKLCSKCNKNKEISLFWAKKTSKDGLDTYCNECRKIIQKKWLNNNKDKRKKTQRNWYFKYKTVIKEKKRIRENKNPEETKLRKKIYNRTYILKKKYGITEDIFNQMVLKQQGKCAICYKDFNQNDIPVIDHNHNNGKVRGILCTRCNIHLGFYEKDKEFHKKANKYLT